MRDVRPSQDWRGLFLMGRISWPGYGVGMENRRFDDTLRGLALFIVNPLLWLIDVTLQKIWPLTDPRPPQGSVRVAGSCGKDASSRRMWHPWYSVS